MLKKLETHYSNQKVGKSEPNGLMIPVWNILFHLDELKTVNYVYLTSIFPKRVKGPYLHTMRNSLLVAITGEALIVIKENDQFTEQVLRPYDMIQLTAGTGYAILGTGQTESLLLNICDYPWLPNTQETISPDFSKYNFEKYL